MSVCWRQATFTIIFTVYEANDTPSSAAVTVIESFGIFMGDTGLED